MIILAIESSCDETAVALVRDGREVLTDQVFSQADLHAIYGGVVPRSRHARTWRLSPSWPTVRWQ